MKHSKHVNGTPEQQTESTTLLNTLKTPKKRNLVKVWDDTNTTTIPITILNLVKSLLGAAMLSMPWALAHSTFIPGIIGLLFSVVYAFITCMFIIEACEATNMFEYSALLAFVHPHWERLAAVILIYVCLSSCLSYVILVGDFVTDGMGALNPDFRFAHDRQIYIIIINCALLLPLSLCKKFDSLKASSIIGNISNLYCVVLAIAFACSFFVSSNHELGDGFVWNDWNVNILIITNVCAKGYVSHYPIPPMYEQLRNRSVPRMRFVLMSAFSIVTLIYLSFAIAGYYLYGINTEGDVLNSYPRSIPFTIARFAMALSIIGTYPIIFKSLMQTIEDKFFSLKRGSRYNFDDHASMRVFIICLLSIIMMVIAVLVNNVGPVSSIEGAVTILGVIALFPILIAWKIGTGENINISLPRVGDYYSTITVIDANIVDDHDSTDIIKQKSSNRMIYVSYLGFLLLLGIGLGIGGIILQLVLL